MSLKVNCPRCGTITDFAKELNPSRPFCSERCKLIDLGDWADEKFAVPVVDQNSNIFSDENEKED